MTLDLEGLYPPRLDLAQLPTPLVPLDRLSEQLGGPRIWLKRDDLTEAIAAGNKIRKLEFVIARALEEGADTLITCGGVQSNHCRATAVIAAKLGLKCHLLLRGREQLPADGNLFLDQLFGATVTFASRAEFIALDQLLSSTASTLREKGDKPFCIPIGASDATGLWGYIAASEELSQDFERHGMTPSHVISATGSGGTLGGLTLGAVLLDQPWIPMGFNVSDDRAYFDAQIRRDVEIWRDRYPGPAKHLPSEFEINITEGYKGPGYGIPTTEVLTSIRTLAELEGVLLDPVYTGKAFFGMVEEIRQGHFQHSEDLVFIHTGGVFGNFPFRQAYADVKVQ